MTKNEQNTVIWPFISIRTEPPHLLIRPAEHYLFGCGDDRSGSLCGTSRYGSKTDGQSVANSRKPPSRSARRPRACITINSARRRPVPSATPAPPAPPPACRSRTPARDRLPRSHRATTTPTMTDSSTVTTTEAAACSWRRPPPDSPAAGCRPRCRHSSEVSAPTPLPVATVSDHTSTPVRRIRHRCSPRGPASTPARLTETGSSWVDMASGAGASLQEHRKLTVTGLVAAATPACRFPPPWHQRPCLTAPLLFLCLPRRRTTTTINIITFSTTTTTSSSRSSRLRTWMRKLASSTARVQGVSRLTTTRTG